MEPVVIKVIDAVPLPNGWMDVSLSCVDEECEGHIPIGECFYDDEGTLQAVKNEFAHCTLCNTKIDVPHRLWIQ